MIDKDSRDQVHQDTYGQRSRHTQLRTREVDMRSGPRVAPQMILYFKLTGSWLEGAETIGAREAHGIFRVVSDNA
jgi:hypothetical protein